MTRVTHIVPATRITHTALDARVVSGAPQTSILRITQTVIQTRVRIAGPSVETGSSSSAPGRERRHVEHLQSDLQLEAKNSGYCYTNRDAGDDIALALPPSSLLQGGEVFRFRVHEDGFYLRVTAPGSDVIRGDTTEASYMRCNGKGGALELEYQGDGEWFIVSGAEIGLWLFDE